MKAVRTRVASALPEVPVARLVGHSGPIQTVRFTGDGKYCLTGGVDRTVRLWNPARPDPTFPTPRGGPQPRPRKEDYDQKKEVSVGRPVADLPRALPIQSYQDSITHAVSALAVDADSTTVAVATDKNLVVLDIATQQAKRRFQGHWGRVNAVSISQGSEMFLSASYDTTVRIWDGRSRSKDPIQILPEARDSVTSVQVEQSLSQAIIRTASVDGVVRSYDVRMGVLRCDDLGSPITSMAATWDGQCLAVSCLDGTIRLMDLDSGQLLNTFCHAHVAGQYGLECAVTADDAYVVTGSEDGQVVLYDLVRAEAMQKLQGHTRPTCAVAPHPQLDHTDVIITASFDGHAVVWAHAADTYFGSV